MYKHEEEKEDKNEDNDKNDEREHRDKTFVNPSQVNSDMDAAETGSDDERMADDEKKENI